MHIKALIFFFFAPQCIINDLRFPQVAFLLFGSAMRHKM